MYVHSPVFLFLHHTFFHLLFFSFIILSPPFSFLLFWYVVFCMCAAYYVYVWVCPIPTLVPIHFCLNRMLISGPGNDDECPLSCHSVPQIPSLSFLLLPRPEKSFPSSKKHNFRTANVGIGYVTYYRIHIVSK